MAKSPRIYRNEKIPHADIPNVDLLTLLFEDHEQGIAQPDTVLHADAANPENKFTKATLQKTFQRIAHGLRTGYGVGASGASKDVITVISYGQVLIPAVYLGVVCAGGIYSAASPSSTVAELARQIKVGTSSLIICGTEHIEVTKAAAKECGIPLSQILVVESTPTNTLTSLTGKNVISSQELQWQRITDPVILKSSTITILWSSGTTGLPKGVSLSHLNLVAESVLINYQPRAFVMHQLETDPESYKAVEYKTLAHLPISHIAGLFGYMITATYNGGTVYWMRKYKWNDLLKYARKYEITAFYTVPSIYLRISKSPDVGDAFQYVEAASTGAAPMDGKLQTASNKRLGNGQDTFIGQTWGLSETTGAVTAPIRGETDITGCIGWILPDVELRIVDDDFRDVDFGKEGEMLIRSPLVMNGYFNNEEATKEAFHDFGDDGKGPWFCTGDIGVQRDEKFYIVDRKKELLKYKGLQIAPAEIENLLFTHPAVAEAAVVGVPAPEDPGTEWPRAYVVLARDMSGSSSKEVKNVQSWPVAPKLEAEAMGEDASAGDSSKKDTLSQTRYVDVKNEIPQKGKVTSMQSYPVTPELNAKAVEERAGDSSKQDTLSQTRYTDGKLPQKRVEGKETEVQSYPVSPELNSRAAAERDGERDGSKQDTLEQTRYQADKGAGGVRDSSKQDTIRQTRYVDKKGNDGLDSSKQDTIDQTRYGDKKGDDDLVEELKKYVADRLAGHKHLRGGIKFVPELPKNAIGKFLRRELRQRAKQEIVEERGISKAKL